MILEVCSNLYVMQPFWSLSSLRWSYKSSTRDFLCLPYQMDFCWFCFLCLFAFLLVLSMSSLILCKCVEMLATVSKL